MKIWALFMALYIGILASVPCTDGAINHENTEEHHDHSSSEDTHQDLCSPFCACSCCGVTFILNMIAHTDNLLLLSSTTFKGVEIAFTSKFLSTTLGSIWQPPKI
jgi:hypothetical protein